MIAILRLILITAGNDEMLELAAFSKEIESPTNFKTPTPEAVPTAPIPVPLRTLRSGQRAVVVSLNGSAHEVARLSEMGLRRGVQLTVLRNGITCILQLEGHRLCIRLSKELVVLVIPV